MCLGGLLVQYWWCYLKKILSLNSSVSINHHPFLCLPLLLSLTVSMSHPVLSLVLSLLAFLGNSLSALCVICAWSKVFKYLGLILTISIIVSVLSLSVCLSLCYSYTLLLLHDVVHLGSLLAFLGLSLSAFMPNLQCLFFTLGILTGAGIGLSTTPGMLYRGGYEKPLRPSEPTSSLYKYKKKNGS